MDANELPFKRSTTVKTRFHRSTGVFFTLNLRLNLRYISLHVSRVTFHERRTLASGVNGKVKVGH